MSGDWVVWQVVVGAVFILSLLLLAIGLMFERAWRRRAEVLLGERLQFETLLSEQVATFSRISAADVDREIQRALRRIADLLAVDWGNLTEYSDGSRTARVTHWWVADGVGPQPEAIGFEEIPWVVTRLRRGELVRFSKIDELPEGDATVDRETYRRLGVKSQVAVPLTVEGTVVGALAFSTVGTERAWRDEF
ncbi:MAG TPA: GAF domain-containing protein, partial [Methylomirabilota bacterium]|nr:GAF domain-containing protein [Methylomirabilota bacterium]